MMNPKLQIMVAAPLFLTLPVAAGANGTAVPRDARDPRVRSLGEGPALPSERSELASSPFRFRQTIGAAAIKSQSRAHEWESGSFTLNTMRAKSKLRPDGPAQLNFNRFKVLASDVGLVHDLSARDSVSLALSYALESRRPSLIIAARRTYKTSNSAVTLGWTRGGTLRLSASLFSTRINASRSERERIVHLAGGGAPAMSGTALIASFSPSGDADRLTYGVDLRNQSLARRDATLIGVAPGQRDARVSLFFRQSF